MAAIKETVFNCSAICAVTILRYTTTSTMDRAIYKESSQDVSKELERTDNIMWEEEDDAWMEEADDSWFTEVAILYYVVETILNDILNKVCHMS